MTLDGFEEVLVRYFTEFPTIGICLIFSPWLDWGCVIFGKKTSEVKCLSHHIISYQEYILTSMLINVAITLNLLAEIVFVRLLSCEVTHFSPFYIVLLGRESELQPPHRELGVRIPLLKDRVSTKLFGIFYMEDLAILPHLLFYAIYSYQYGLIDNLFYLLYV